MAKPEAWQLDRAVYPMLTVVETRFQDLDPQQHLNNVSYAAIFETARFRLDQRYAGGITGNTGDRRVLAAQDINFLGEGGFPEPVEVGMGIERIGTSSFTLLAAGFQSTGCIATCRSTIVFMVDDRVCPVPGHVREIAETLRIRQR